MPARSRRRERARAAAAAASAAAGPAPARPSRKRTRSVRTCRPTPRSRRACPPPARTRTRRRPRRPRRPRSRPAPKRPRRRPARTTPASRSRPAPRATSRTRTGRTAAGSAEPPLRRLRLLVAYDGGAFTGFARQPDRRTVQGELEAVLARLARAPVETVGAGRTDAGVHAHGQVVHADVPARLDPARVRRALNAALGPAVVVRVADWAPDGFDARFSAVRRHYRYRIDDSGDPDPLTRSFVLAWRRPLDLVPLRQAAACLVGEHDFAAFCRARAGASTTRRLRSLRVRRVRGLVEVRVVADAFCWQMVRSIVGYLLAGRDRAAAGSVAPPHGLVLETVTYPPALALPAKP